MVTKYHLFRSEFDDLFMRKTYSSLMMSKYNNFTREGPGDITREKFWTNFWREFWRMF